MQGLEEKRRGNRRRKGKKRRIVKGERIRVDDGVGGNGRTKLFSHVRVVNALEQNDKVSNQPSAFLNDALSVDLKHRFGNLKAKERLMASKQQQMDDVSYYAVLKPQLCQ